VSKAVGNAVVRNRTKRRLRHIAAAHVTEIACGTDVVVRANPAAARAAFTDLEAAFTRQLAKACGEAA
jgi:ribonuclease P protein component